MAVPDTSKRNLVFCSKPSKVFGRMVHAILNQAAIFQPETVSEKINFSVWFRSSSISRLIIS